MNNGYSGIFSNPVFSNPAIPMQKELPVYTQRAGRLGPQFNVRPTPPNWPGASVRGLGGFGAAVAAMSECEVFYEAYAAEATPSDVPEPARSLIGKNFAPVPGAGPWEGRWALDFGKYGKYRLNLYDRNVRGGWVVGSTTKGSERSPRTTLTLKKVGGNRGTVLIGHQRSKSTKRSYVFKLVMGPGGVVSVTEDRTQKGKCPGAVWAPGSGPFQGKWKVSNPYEAMGVLREGSTALDTKLKLNSGAPLIDPFANIAAEQAAEERAAATRSLIAREGGLPPSLPEPEKKPRWGLWLGLGAVVLLLGGSGYYLSRRR